MSSSWLIVCGFHSVQNIFCGEFLWLLVPKTPSWSSFVPILSYPLPLPIPPCLLQEEKKSGGELAFLSEVELSSRAVHRNLMHSEGFCVERGECMLVLPFYANGSVASRTQGEAEQKGGGGDGGDSPLGRCV